MSASRSLRALPVHHHVSQVLECLRQAPAPVDAKREVVSERQQCLAEAVLDRHEVEDIELDVSAGRYDSGGETACQQTLADQRVFSDHQQVAAFLPRQLQFDRRTERHRFAEPQPGDGRAAPLPVGRVQQVERSTLDARHVGARRPIAVRARAARRRP